jgi:dCMP deaminase
MKMANLVAERSTCLRKKVGTVIVKGKRVISTGYNGNCIPGDLHCIDTEVCERDLFQVKSGTMYEIGKCTHSEASAIAQCAKFGIPTQGTTLYVNSLVCILCAKLIISAGISKVVYIYEEERPKNGIELLKKAGVELKPMYPEISYKKEITTT